MIRANSPSPSYRPLVPKKSLRGLKILVDPGHGGSDPGAVGKTGATEKKSALEMSLKLADRLKELGATVRMTRDTDKNVSRPGGSQGEELRARVRIANSWPADYFVSMHCNAHENRSANGTETFHARKGSRTSVRMAHAIHDEIVDKTDLRDRKVKGAGFYVLRHTRMPAVLVEAAFISNAREEKLLQDPKFQDTIATAVADGLVKSIGVDRPGNRKVG